MAATTPGGWFTASTATTAASAGGHVASIAEEDVQSQARAEAIQDKWQTVGRWMGTALRRSEALRGERCRRGWTCNISDDPLAKPALVTDGHEVGGFITSVGAEVGEQEGPGDLGFGMEAADEDFEPMIEGAFTVTAAQAMTETATVMREQERPLRDIFRVCATVKVTDGPQLMSRSDLHAFFDDLSMADPMRHKLAHASVIDRLYDEAVSLQCNFTKIGSGLSFWSFKAVLNNVIYELGLATGWRRLVAATFSASPDEMVVAPGPADAAAAA